MARKNTIRLLLINASENDSELLVSLFRSAGRVARAQRVASANELEEALQLSWDLLIADDNHPDLKVETCLEHLQKARIDFPIFVLRDTAEVNALFAAGVSDVIAPADEQRLICAAMRELENVEMRRSVQKLKLQLEEAEQRNALLLGEADHAIAYVADGMVISANSLFAERFGFASPDDIDCAPIVDLINASDQDGFKTALKNGIETEFSCSGQHTDGSTFTASVRLLNSNYDGDACTQLIIGTELAAAPRADNDFDADTGVHSRAYLRARIEQRRGNWLFFVALEKFDELRRELGFAATLELTHAAADFLRHCEPIAASCIARVADGIFGILIDADNSDHALRLARELLQQAGEHPFNHSLRFAIGIAPVDTDDVDATLDHAFEAASTALARKNDEPIFLHREAIAKRTQTRATSPNHALDDALEEQRFAILFQPIISLRGSTGEHYETLLRMRGATDSLELPDNFIATLGLNPNNAKLDRWILLEATKQLATNRARGNDTRLIINLTANVLLDDTLPSWLGVALKAAGLPAMSVILQLHESDVINDLKAAKTFAAAVHQLGCRFSISGFGRIPEAEKTLKNVQTDIVQIDGGLTRNLQTSGDASALKALVAAIGASDVKTIVPFVENASVLATLWQVGADFIQGHYLQAPSREMNYEFTDIA